MDLWFLKCTWWKDIYIINDKDNILGLSNSKLLFENILNKIINHFRIIAYENLYGDNDVIQSLFKYHTEANIIAV